MRKWMFLLTVLIISASSAVTYAQVIQKNNLLPGTWLGALNVGAIELRMVFNIKITDNDSLVATLDSPDQGAKGIPLGSVILKNDTLTIKAPLLLGEYRGIFKSDTVIDGSWSQRGQTYPLPITRLREQYTVNRPQEPKPPFPYSAEEITFPNKKFNIYLSGTLTIPQGDGPFPAVILISGSGAQDRNETLMGHKPFLVISDYLTRNGIAVLRYDDRGVAKSQGSQLNASTADLATDAEAAFLYLKDNPRIDPSCIGLIGHSEGGLIAPIVASENREVGFLVSLAGTGVNGEEILFRQQADIARLMGVGEDDIMESRKINMKLYSEVKKEKDNQKAEKKVVSAYRKILEKNGTSAEDAEKAVNQLLASFNATTYTWFRYFLVTDPAKFWKKVDCPVLALNGEKDLQVAAEINLAAIDKALKGSGNDRVQIVSLPGLNHLFQHCTTGLPAEYGKIEETFSPEVLKIISDWITGLKVSR